MSTPAGIGQRAPELSGEIRRKLEAELSLMNAQRAQLRGDNAEDHRAAELGDRAEAMRRADDVFRIEDRIREITRLLTAGPLRQATADNGPGLPEGMRVTLRFADGDEETYYATSILDTAPDDPNLEILGVNSPLAKALTGHEVGDIISWVTPSGQQKADIIHIG
jgi:transcription elongation GreA/GreB family factor